MHVLYKSHTIPRGSLLLSKGDMLVVAVQHALNSPPIIDPVCLIRLACFSRAPRMLKG